MDKALPNPIPPLPSARETPELTFAEFLQSIPVEVTKLVSEVLGWTTTHSYPFLEKPDLRLHCPSDDCSGIRTFTTNNGNAITSNWDYEYMHYTCRNCKKSAKTFSLLVRPYEKSGSAKVYKLGEYLPFGPPLHPKVIALVGSDRELFLKGRRAELRGLGIGAFAYYRRVVDEQKGRIISEIGRVASRLGATPGILQLFAEAEKETQFSAAIDKINDAIPESLLVTGHNPLTLLYSALSEGLHEKTDEECLELATSIRVVLTELAERISTALKDEAELRGAVSQLLRRNSK